MGVLLRLLKRADEALDYDRPGGLLSRASPAALLLGLAMLWVSLSVASPDALPAAIAGVAALHLAAGRARVVAAARAALYPAAMIAGVGLLFSPMAPLTREWAWYGALLYARAYGMASTALIGLGEAGPLGVQCVSARLSALLHDSTLLLLRVAPQTVRDALIGAHAQALLGKGVREALVGSVLSGVRRAEMLRASLFLRGAGPGRRSPLCGPGDKPATLVALLSGAGPLIGVLLTALS